MLKFLDAVSDRGSGIILTLDPGSEMVREKYLQPCALRNFVITACTDFRRSGMYTITIFPRA
jgi:hypothetical protein